MQLTPWLKTIAQSVVDGRATGASPCRLPQEFFDDNADEAAKCDTVATAVRIGVRLLMLWTAQQVGPGAQNWPPLLAKWIAASEADFCYPGVHGERDDYAQLLQLLDDWNRDLAASEYIN